VINVFVEEVSTKDPKNLIARTDQDKKVVFPGDPFLVGKFVTVRLVNLFYETFIGDAVILKPEGLKDPE